MLKRYHNPAESNAKRIQRFDKHLAPYREKLVQKNPRASAKRALRSSAAPLKPRVAEKVNGARQMGFQRFPRWRGNVGNWEAPPLLSPWKARWAFPRRCSFCAWNFLGAFHATLQPEGPVCVTAEKSYAPT